MDTVAKPRASAQDARPGIDLARSLADRAFVARDGEHLLLRPIRADDVTALQRGFAALSPDEVRMRFLHPMTELPDAVARSFCNIDPRHAVAFVLADPAATPSAQIHGVARAYIDPATLAAEFALIVQHRLAGQGYGSLLMERLIAECRERGVVQMWGDVLAENGAMLELCDHLGFARQALRQEPGVVRVTLAL